MNTMQEKAFYQLAGNNMENVPVSELFKLANEHPYFSAAQYFLSYKLKEEKHIGFLPQLQKTALFFNNPHWLHYQLLHKKEAIRILHHEYKEEETKPLLNFAIQEEIAQQNAVLADNTPVETIASIDLEEKKAPVAEASTNIETSSEVLIEEVPIEAIKEEVIEPSPIHIPTVEFVREMMENIQPNSTQEIILPREIDNQDKTVTTDDAASITSFALEATEEDMYAVQETVKEEALAIEEAIVAETPTQLETTNAQEDFVEETTNFPGPETITINEETTIVDVLAKTMEEAPIAANIEEEIVDNEEQVEEESALTADKIASILNQQLEEFKKPVVADTELQIQSEPFHTVDYFASQGIKVGADTGSQDQLSKQLRKFTDWLKHMKQAEANPNDLGTDPELESAIQSIAKTSNEAKEIVTETMAEVLEKQGKLDKAIQLYIKLSFLNPDKSAYFATKIQQLKGI